MRPHLERIFTHDLAWVGCQYPTPSLAQEAGLSLQEFEDFLYGACLLDWDAERERMSRYAQHFDGAEEVRIVGDGTDIRLALAGRPALVDAGGANMPGGEFFLSPVEDSAEGEIVFGEFPAVYNGREVAGIALRFEGGASSRRPPRPTRSSCWRSSTSTKALAASASSGSAATPASRAT